MGVGKDTFVYVKTGTPSSPWIKIPGSDGVRQASQAMDGSLIGASTGQKPLSKASLDPATHWNPISMTNQGWVFNEVHQRSDSEIVCLGTDGKIYTTGFVIAGPWPQGRAWSRWCCLGGINFSQDGASLWGASSGDGRIWKKPHNTQTENDGDWGGTGANVATTNPGMLSIIDMPDGTFLAIGNDNKTYTLSSIVGTPQATSDTVDMVTVSKWDATKGAQWLPPATGTSSYTSEPVYMVSGYEIEPIDTKWDESLGLVI
jgi:hypothetical protein